MSDDRFEHNPKKFVGVADPKVIYVGIEKREDFDKIAVALRDRGQNEHGHVLTKTVQNSDGVMVIFQYWLKSLTIKAIAADLERLRAEREESRGRM